MAKTKNDYKEKAMDALKIDLQKIREELFKARLDLSKRRLSNTSSITNMRKEIAKILTAIKAKEGVKNG
ncbi:MAG TPA: 50S ribosomal protein L29 [Patescibacteria group bacterium]|nr:50S ribosomal protein L29 [Patescibacteria group bacterium]